MIFKKIKIIFKSTTSENRFLETVSENQFLEVVILSQPPLKVTYFYNCWHCSGFKTVSEDHF
jgi:hypothetical protein